MIKYKFLSSITIPVFTIAIISGLYCASDKKISQNTKIIKTAVSDKKSGGPDYSGIYKISDTEICDLTITIKKNNNEYTYTIYGAGIKSSGKLSIEKDGEEVYLNFDSTLRSVDNNPVTGAYINKTIVIQNYGNAMNQYMCFKNCDAKYLEFVKSVEAYDIP